MITLPYTHNLEGVVGLHGGSLVKNPPARAGDVGSIPGLGRSPGGGGCAVFLPEESQ